MELDQIRAFVFTIEEGSVLRAARRMNRSQPAVTRLIQSLEGELGAKLLNRSTKPALSTEFGQRVIDPCRAVLEAVESLSLQGKRGASQEVHPFRLGVFTPLTRILASPAISKTLAASPQFRLSVMTDWSAVLLQKLERKELDALLLMMPTAWQAPGSLKSHLFRKEELVVIAPKSLRLPEKPGLRDLAPFPWVLNDEGCGIRKELQTLFDAQGLQLQLRLELHGALSQHVDFVASGFGLGMIPKRVLSAHPLRSRVRRIPVKEDPMLSGAWLVWRPFSSALDPFWKQLRQSLVLSLSPEAF